MKIGFFTSIGGWGGSESYLRSLMLGVCEKGNEAILYGIDGSRLFSEMKKEGVACVAWKSNVDTVRTENMSNADIVAGRSGWSLRRLLLALTPVWIKLIVGNIREVLCLYRLFKARPLDVMHVSVSGYEVAGVAARLAGIPCLAMNMVTPPFEEYWFRRWLMKTTMRMYDLVSSQSNACTTAWMGFAGVKKTKCSHVWSSVDLISLGNVDDSPSLRDDNLFRVVSLGRLHPMKGYRYLIEAAGMLNDCNVVIDIYGEGDQRRELEELIEAHNLNDIVHLCGHVENTEEKLRSADCFVLPSISHESCPAVLPEAMAFSLPLITSDFAPLAEVNIDGETGIVVPMRDSKALADAIGRLNDDSALSARMGEAGCQRAHKYFSRDHMIEKTLRLYAVLCGPLDKDIG